MANFNLGETIICSIVVKTLAGMLTDPATSMKLTIYDSHNGAEVDGQAMVKDSTGEYHYDYTPAGTALTGNYRVIYTATDGARITMKEDTFILE